MKKRTYLVAALLATASTSPLSAQQIAAPEPAASPAVSPQSAQRAIVFGIGAGSMSFQSAAATASQVGDRAYGIQLDLGLLVARHFYFGTDLGGQFLKDKAQFTQNTTGGERQSTSNVTYLSALTGMRAMIGGPLAVGVNGGYSFSMTRRSIDNCVDCRVDKLHIPGGAFAEPLLLVGGGSKRLRVSDRMYLGSDGMRSMISVGAEFQPGRK